jgi:ribosomal peptide maturation radical SAM protein 1
MAQRGISLIAMPWPMLDTPSIQLGLLTALLRDAGFRVSSHSLYLDAAAYFIAATASLPEAERLTVEDYQQVASRWWTVGLGDWIFCEAEPSREPAYRDYARSRGIRDGVLERARRMRSLVPGFLARCAEEVLAERPGIVGFTSSFNQNLGSLALARELKRRDGSIQILFGGANCDGPMGAALHRLFPWIDVVVRGEAEAVLPELCAELLDGREPTPRPGLCIRSRPDGASRCTPLDGAFRPDMDAIPAPDYDEYFSRLRESPIRDAVLPEVRLPIETARGCWWGEKAHCTFCGLNGSSMSFRAKSVERVLHEVEDLARRYKRTDFEVVDNILDMGYLRSVLPRLRESRRAGEDYTFFYETKANLRHDQIRLLRDAGVLRIQPGIESLSTPILRLMRKGVTALQNIRLLKWAARYGVQVTWNIIYGFPGEPPDEYPRMAELVPSLVHLKPPGLVPLQLQRFSPYHEAAASWGLELIGPEPYYTHIYDADPEALAELAYAFTYRHADGRDPERYVAPLRQALAAWDEAYRRVGRQGLRYTKGPDYLRIRDLRPGRPARDYLLSDVEAEIYLGCDAGATPSDLRASLRDQYGVDLEEDRIRAFLDDLVSARLAYEEAGRYLALAIPVNVESEPASKPAARPGATVSARSQP